MKALIDYAMGVKEGDPLAPLLFIFMMLIIAELLQRQWSELGLEMASYDYDSNNDQLLRHRHNLGCMSLLEVFILLYTDDGACPFASHLDMISGTNAAYNTLKRLGLLMHVGTAEKESKTEATFFPSRTSKNRWILESSTRALPASSTPVTAVT